jgi:putative colanic acid biosysnthesis UDP-glucose lipid carrier transferase
LRYGFFRSSAIHRAAAEGQGRFQRVGHSVWLIYSGLDVVTLMALSIVIALICQLFYAREASYLASHAGFGLLTSAVFLAVQRMKGVPAVVQAHSPSEIFEELARAWLLAVLVLMALFFTLDIGADVSRMALFLMGVCGFPALLASRLAASALVEALFGRIGLRGRKTVYVAYEGKFLSSTDKTSLGRLGYEARSFLSGSGHDTMAQVAEAVTSEVQRLAADAVVLDFPLSQDHAVAALVKELGDIPVQVLWILDQGPMRLLERPFGLTSRKAAIELRRPPMTTFEQGMKRAFDMLIAAFSLVLLSPLLLMTAILVKLESPGPVIFRQNRRGRDGKPFTIYKFRSMRVMENGSQIRQARRNDPRVTRIGAVIRRTSIDELPQLFNVLKGDMSLIGPRPHALAHDDEYTQQIPNYDFRYFMKPGLTGWAQVNGYRGETDTLDAMEKRIEHDLWYANNWSVALDLRILLRTVLIVLGQKNAY